jgi:two-component system sensor histidine kinase and response regulator WspE
MSQDNNGDLSQFSMLDLFRMEADSQTQILTDGLLAMERLKDDASAVESMMRAAHSIKGAAAIVGLEVVVQLAHGMEDAFIAAQNGKLALTPNRVDVLLAGVDLILQHRACRTAASTPGWPPTANRSSHAQRHHHHRLPAGAGGLVPPPPPPAVAHPLQGRARIPDRRTADRTTAARACRRRRRRAPRACADEARAELRQAAVAGQRVAHQRAPDASVHAEPAALQAQPEQPVLADRTAARSHLQQRRRRPQGKVPAGAAKDPPAQAVRARTHRRHRSLRTPPAGRLAKHGGRSADHAHAPFRDGVQHFPRMVRDLARSLGKDVQLHIIGEDTLVDRDILAKIESPLNHMLRNAIDHGMDSAADRIAAGKPGTGTIVLEAKHRAGMLSIEIRDDGKGVDLEKSAPALSTARWRRRRWPLPCRRRS